ncbi:MAG: hypothetical protein IKM27_04825 [Clostridia bacterium]|nr:hypothetical protein [Clostridia bacterium]MBR6777050.1 hypothetical protein [Clostridia bacterium]
MRSTGKCKAAGCCVAAFGVGIIVSCMLPWVAVSCAVAAVAVAAGILLSFC